MSFVKVAIGSVAVQAGSAIMGARSARKGGKKQKRAARLQSWQQSMESLRAYQQAQAAVATAFQGSGASLESSGAQGVRSSLKSTELNNQQQLAKSVQLAGGYYDALRSASMWSGISSMAGAVGSMASSYGSILPQTPTTYNTGTGIKSTGGSVWNPNTGTYEMPKNFTNKGLGFPGP